MTDHLIRALSRRPLARLVRPAIALAFALVLAFAGGAAMTAYHRAIESVDTRSATFLVSWLRDATLSMPFFLAAMWLALLATRRTLERAGAADARVLGAALLTAFGAAFGSVVTALTGPAHDWLFGAMYPGTGVSAGSVARDVVVAMPVNLVLTALVATLLAATIPWSAPVIALRHSRGTRLAFQIGLVVVLLAPIGLLAQGASQRATAAGGPGTPCPAGAPVKTFDVSAINVDIPLNRFGDHDPIGKMYAITSMIPAIRAQETSRHVTPGLRDDPIQPLVIRANVGDCVEMTFRNQTHITTAAGQASGEFGIHIDGLAFEMGSSGDAVGENPTSAVAAGGTTTYRYYVPNDPDLEGSHYIRPGPGNRQAAAHGLFGVLTVEPAGSTYLHPDTGNPLPSGWGWEATIVPGTGKAFRETSLLHHEIGDEKYLVPSTSADAGGTLPVKDPNTLSYRPGSRALNYRSEPFMHRLEVDPQNRLKAFSYNSYTFGEPATPMPRGYLGDPFKIRLVHAGGEMFHVYHLHGGGDRWRANPKAGDDHNYQQTGLNKSPVPLSDSQRLDSQSIGPGEAYNLEIESGAGGTQQSAGDFLFHCHIAEHYLSGMWSVWRVYDTNQPDFAALPDRTPLPEPVDSVGLIGKTMPDGTTITSANLAQWIEPQLPPRGVPIRAAGDPITLDGAVWNWMKGSGSTADVYYGEPEDTTGQLTGSPFPGRFPNLTGPEDQVSLPRVSHAVPGHPGLLKVDEKYIDFLGPNNRPRILFNPVTGRPAHPVLRTQIGQRPPYTANGHTGAPFLGERANQPPTPGVPSPWANRPDGLCPAAAPLANKGKPFNIVAIQKPIQVTRKGAVDPFGKVYVLAKNKDAVRSGALPSEPLAIRANMGDCVKLTVTTEQISDPNPGFDPEQPHAMVSLHIHHVQFDPSGSDGATAGMAFGQVVQAYREQDGQLAVPAGQGVTSLTIKENTVAAPLDKYRVGIWIGVGLGTERLEIRQVTSVSAPNVNGHITVGLDRPLESDHNADEWAGTEFVQEIWYPDVVLDNIFYHDHVNGRNWAHGLVGQLVIEPRGSTYHDPKTGEEVASGTLVDIRTNDPLAPGLIEGSFREFVLTSINQNPGGGDSTINLKAEPFADRLVNQPDPSLVLSSVTHGDPATPLPKAYAGDPFVIRSINVSSTNDTLRVEGAKFYAENRMRDVNGKLVSSPLSGVMAGVSERWSLMFPAGGERKQFGDYLYSSGIQRRFVQGAWGIIRVLPRKVDDLQSLPGTNVATGPTEPNPAPNKDARPLATESAGEPCPPGAPTKSIQVSAIDVTGLNAGPGRTVAFVPTADVDAIQAGVKRLEPLAVHVAAGTCLDVVFTNQRTPTGAGLPRASFHVQELLRDPRSSGVNVGYNPEQTVAPGQSRRYRLYAYDQKGESALINDEGGDDTGPAGLYGAVIVGPPGARFFDPTTGVETTFGTQVDVQVPGMPGYRDFALFMSDNDPALGSNTMPYPVEVEGAATLNYGQELGRINGGPVQFQFNPGDAPSTLLRAYSGDPMRVHAIGAPGSEQPGVFSLGGHTWGWDPNIPRSEQLAAQGFGPYMTIDAHVRGGAGRVGDYFVGNLRRPMNNSGQWGILRVATPPATEPAPGEIRKLVDVPGPPAADPLPPLAAELPPLPAQPAPVPTPSTPVVKRLKNLVLPKSVTTASLTRNGLRFTLGGPKDTRALRLTMFRVVGGKKVVAGTALLQVKTTATKAAAARIGSIGVGRTGLITGRWKPNAATLAKLRTGKYFVRVQTGTSKTTFLAETLTGSTRVIRSKPVK